MNNNRMGQMSESLFSFKVVRYGHIISEPIGGYSRYDFLVDNGLDILKVQVKARSTIKGQKDYYQFQMETGSQRDEYSPNDVDIYAFHLHTHDLWYLLPYDVISGKKSLCISVNAPKYLEYLDNWKILNKTRLEFKPPY